MHAAAIIGADAIIWLALSLTAQSQSDKNAAQLLVGDACQRML
jgi:hypothetical protein